MFFIECKNIVTAGVSAGATLAYAGGHQCLLQNIDEGDVRLVEHVFPVVHSTDPAFEVAIEVDDFVLKCAARYSLMRVDATTLTFDNEVVYAYTRGEIMGYETRLPTLSCCLTVPDRVADLLEDDDGESLRVRVTENFLHLRTEHGLECRFPVIHCFQQFRDDGVAVNSCYLTDLLTEHAGQFCKLYLEKDFPVCIETVSGAVSERNYLAPLYLMNDL